MELNLYLSDRHTEKVPYLFSQIHRGVIAIEKHWVDTIETRVGIVMLSHSAVTLGGSYF